MRTKKNVPPSSPPTPHLNGGVKHEIQFKCLSLLQLTFSLYWGQTKCGTTSQKSHILSKIKPASGYWTAVGILSKPTYNSYMQNLSCSLAVKCNISGSCHSRQEGSVASVFQFFVSSWLAYKRFSCIKIKCIWPIDSIYTITVSKNFRNFSYLKGLESSTADNWRLCPSFLSL